MSYPHPMDDHTGFADPNEVFDDYDGDDVCMIAASRDMFNALVGLSVIAQQHIEDLCADLQEGRQQDAIWKMELARWQAVLNAIAKATGKL